MSSRTFRNKADIGRELPPIKSHASNLIREFDKNELMAFSLSVMSGLNDLKLNVQTGWYGIADDPLRSLIMRHLRDWDTYLDFVISYAWDYLPPSTRHPGQPPAVLLSLVKGPHEFSEAFVKEKIDKGQYDGEKDMIVGQPFTVAGRPGTVIFVVRNVLKTSYQELVERWLDVRKLLADFKRVGTALRYGGELWLDDVGLHHPAQKVVDDEEVVRELTANGYLSSELYLPHKWATDLTDVGQVTMEKAVVGKGALNRRLLREETNAILRDFGSLPRFPEIFKNMMNMPLEEFMKLTHEVAMLGYSRPSTVFIGRPARVINKLSKKTKLKKRQIAKMLDVLHTRGRGVRFRPILRLSRDLWLTSFDWAATYKLIALNLCFLGPYEFDLRGKAFERRCRKRLSDEGFAVYPNRIEIRFPPPLEEAFADTFGIRKKKSDIDLLAHSNGVILIGECKEIKPNIKKSYREKLLRRLQHSRRQLELISSWMASSEANLRCLISRKILSSIGVDRRSRLMLIPIFLVSYDMQLPKEGALTARYERLKGIGELPSTISHLSTQDLQGTCVELAFEIWGTDCTIRSFPVQTHNHV